MSEELPVTLWMADHDGDFYNKGEWIDACYQDGSFSVKYTLVHNNPEYHVIKKNPEEKPLAWLDTRDNIVVVREDYYNGGHVRADGAYPHNWIPLTLSNNHVIKKSDVDGDVMAALDRLKANPETWTQEQHDLLNIVRNALIAQSDPDMVRAWQPIETIPEGVVVQIAWEMFEEGVVTGKIEDGWIYTDKIECEFKGLKCLPTHWMPLPNPPINDVLNYKDGDDE